MKLNFSLGEKLKRRIEDLERWRDFALACTSELPSKDYERIIARRGAPTLSRGFNSSEEPALHGNEQPLLQIIPSREHLLSGSEGGEATPSSTKDKSPAEITFDDLTVYSAWCPSVDSGVELGEIQTTQCTGIRDDFETYMNNVGASEPVPSAVLHNDIRAPEEIVVEKDKHIPSDRVGSMSYSAKVSFWHVLKLSL